VILVDSSVWIDFFRGNPTPAADRLRSLLPTDEELAVGDLVTLEVLQGFRNESEFQRARRLLKSLDYIEIGGYDAAVQAARNYRRLRTLGITVRKTIDVLIATRCIMSGIELLHNDRDFDPFVQHLGLRSLL
jgi:predicted nucleic acid-binding protein